ncbi:hypothetical protein GCM10010341_00650 [Streptomyces noursei]|nr:hypothetical protein GCM10010341_00650 [Streptomyces noursei]
MERKGPARKRRCWPASRPSRASRSSRTPGATRERLVGNVAGHLLGGVSRPVLDRALRYWRNIDKNLGDRIAKKVNGG